MKKNNINTGKISAFIRESLLYKSITIQNTPLTEEEYIDYVVEELDKLIEERDLNNNKTDNNINLF